MKRFAFLFAVVLAVAFLIGCSQDRSITPDQSATTDHASGVTADPEAVANEIVARAGWESEMEDLKEDGPALTGSGRFILSYDREVVVDDVVHYYFEVRVGYGEYDVIGIHRVVRENRPWKPIRTKKSIFLQHGDAIGFTKFMFGVDSPSTPDELSAAVYLAQNDADVWGIDQDWILVPQATADLSFMAGWGMQHQVDNLEVGLMIARFTRLFTGNGWRKMHLLGYSSGVFTTFALLNQETQLPPGHRNVAGYIPVDAPYKTDFAPTQGLACATAPALQDSLDVGTYGDPAGILFQTLGMLGSFDPDSPSPVVPGLTNLQAALFFGAATHQFLPMTPWFHYEAGIFNEFGIPTGLQYTAVDGWLDFLMGAASYEPIAFMRDYMTLICDGVDVPWDDHLSDITNPIFAVGAVGGLGELTEYTTTLTGSSDVTFLNVSLWPPEAIMLDFGHIDLWTADNAEALVWTPILEWVNDHTPGEGDWVAYKKN